MENTMMNTLDANEPKISDSENPAFLLPETDDPEYNRNAKEYNINYCLKKIDEIGKETETIKEAFYTLQGMDVSSATPAGGSADESAKAVATVIRTREETNQKKIDFYRDMIDRFLPPKKDLGREQERREQYLNWVSDIICNSDREPNPEDLIKLYKEFQ